MINIVYIKQHSVFSSDGNSGRMWREEKHVKWLEENGYNIEWISSDFDHYGKTKRKPIPDTKRVSIRFLSTLGYSKNVSLKRLVGNWQFSIKLLMHLFYNKKRIDKIICAYPTPESSLICVLFSRLTGTPLIIDMRDNWPEAIVSSVKGPVARCFIFYCRILNHFVFNWHHRFIGMSDGVLRKVIKFSGARDGLALAIPNAVDLDVSEKLEHYQLDSQRKYISFFGTLNSQFNFDALHCALDEIRQKFPEVVFLIVGDGENYEGVSREFSAVPNVLVLGRLQYSQVLSIAKQSIGFFCFYTNVRAFECHFTNKLVEYLYFGKPFLHNLQSNFSLNGQRIVVGRSLREITLVDFVSVCLIENEKSKEAGLFGGDLPIEFSEVSTKSKFLELLS